LGIEEPNLHWRAPTPEQTMAGKFGDDSGLGSDMVGTMREIVIMMITIEMQRFHFTKLY
jgi:hypothetical protein